MILIPNVCFGLKALATSNRLTMPVCRRALLFFAGYRYEKQFLPIAVVDCIHITRCSVQLRHAAFLSMHHCSPCLSLYI
jgi:hypothetical protein